MCVTAGMNRVKNAAILLNSGTLHVIWVRMQMIIPMIWILLGSRVREDRDGACKRTTVPCGVRRDAGTVAGVHLRHVRSTTPRQAAQHLSG